MRKKFKRDLNIDNNNSSLHLKMKEHLSKKLRDSCTMMKSSRMLTREVNKKMTMVPKSGWVKSVLKSKLRSRISSRHLQRDQLEELGRLPQKAKKL
jgi:hypothetical protein